MVGALARFIPFELPQLALTAVHGGLGCGVDELDPPEPPLQPASISVDVSTQAIARSAIRRANSRSWNAV